MSSALVVCLCRYSFLDIGPLSKGHALVIPKCKLNGVQVCYVTQILHLDHGERLHDVPDEYLTDTLTTAKKIAVALGVQDYNILQASICFTIQ